MFVRNNPDIDYDALEAQAREGLAALDGLAPAADGDGDESPALMAIQSLEELYALDDEDFVQGAYHLFLGRDADTEGFAHYLDLLRQGVSRSAIAAGLRYSRAARARPQRFHLRRAWLGWVAVRTPVLGRVLESLLALAGIANLKRAVLMLQRQQREIQHLKRALMLAEHEQNQLRQEAVAAMERDIDGLRRHWRQDMAALRVENRELRQHIEGAASGDGGGDTLDEDFYLAFESHFRGADGVILERLGFYPPILEQRLPAQLRHLDALDIGCGRGEWLGMLGDAGWRARGVDLNKRNVEACQARGLDARQGDGIAWLRTLDSESAALVSAFHVIEHLTLAQLDSLLTEALRVLAPGGLLILETPNPENLVTAAHLFHTDPTHRHPIPPTLCEFLLDYKGFADIRVHRLHPMPEQERLPEDSEVARRWNRLFHGPQDYGVVARKPEP